MNATSPSAILARFPHLREDATWSERQDAGDRMREIYTAGVEERHLRSIGFVHLKAVSVYGDGKGPYFRVGLGFPSDMGRWLIFYRSYAITDPKDRRHYITQAMRLRDALHWYGLDEHRRKRQ